MTVVLVASTALLATQLKITAVAGTAVTCRKRDIPACSSASFMGGELIATLSF